MSQFARCLVAGLHAHTQFACSNACFQTVIVVAMNGIITTILLHALLHPKTVKGPVCDISKRSTGVQTNTKYIWYVIS